MRLVSAVLLHGALLGCGSSGETPGETTGGGTPGEGEHLAAAVHPLSLALDGDSIWFGDFNAGTISRLPKSGGTPEVVADGQAGAWDLAVDETHVYWTRGGEGSEENSVARAPKSGGAVEMLAVDLSSARRLAVDGEAVYVAAMHGNAVHRIPKDGSPASKLASTNWPHDVVIAGGDVCWTSWVEDGGVECVSSAGGEVRSIASGRARGLATDGVDLFWTLGPAIDSAPVAGGPSKHLADDEPAPDAIALEAGVLYVAGGGAGNAHVAAVPTSGGAVTLLATLEAASPSTVRADATHVYWVDNVGGTDGRVMRAPH